MTRRIHHTPDADLLVRRPDLPESLWGQVIDTIGENA